MVNTDTPLDPSYEQYGLDSGILDTAGATTNASLSTESLIGGTTSNTKYDVLYAGYNNFSQEAILDPFINYAVALEAANGTSLDPNSLIADYTAVNNTNISQFESDTLKTTIMGPINSASSTSTNAFGFGSNLHSFSKKTTFNLMGIPLFTSLGVSPYLSLFNSRAVPLLSLDSFTALSKATTTSIQNSVSSSINYVDKVKDMTADGVMNAMHNNIPLAFGTSRTGSVTTTSMTKETSNPQNPNKATGNPVTQISSILHNGLSFLTSYAPFILLGVGAVAVGAVVLLKSKKRI